MAPKSKADSSDGSASKERKKAITMEVKVPAYTENRVTTRLKNGSTS